jgi:hypothetical protein
VDPDSLNPDPNTYPDPEFQVISDKDPVPYLVRYLMLIRIDPFQISNIK